jgi:hypothetical protein
MSAWIDYPPPPLVRSAADPLLVESNRLDELVAYAEAAGATRVDVDVTKAANGFHVIEALKTVLPFPSWCGSSWDSIDDAFEELRAAWSFPLLMVLRGYGEMLASHQHGALETTIRLHEFQHALSAASDQLIVAFEGASWT